MGTGLVYTIDLKFPSKTHFSTDLFTWPGRTSGWYGRPISKMPLLQRFAMPSPQPERFFQVWAQSSIERACASLTDYQSFFCDSTSSNAPAGTFASPLPPTHQAEFAVRFPRLHMLCGISLHRFRHADSVGTSGECSFCDHRGCLRPFQEHVRPFRPWA